MQKRQFYGSSNKLQAPPPPPSVSTNAPQCKVTIDFLSRLLAKSNNLIKFIFAVPECYENCQLLQPVNEFVEPVTAIQQVMRTADSSQFLSLLPAALQSVATLSITYRRSTSPSNSKLYPPTQTLSLSALCGPLVMC